MYTEVPRYLHAAIVGACLLPFGGALLFVPWEAIKRLFSRESSRE